MNIKLMLDFNGMLTCQGLFLTQERLHVLKSFWVNLYDMKYSNTNNVHSCMVSSISI